MIRVELGIRAMLGIGAMLGIRAMLRNQGDVRDPYGRANTHMSQWHRTMLRVKVMVPYRLHRVKIMVISQHGHIS